MSVGPGTVHFGISNKNTIRLKFSGEAPALQHKEDVR